MEDRLEKLLALPVLAKLGILAGILLLVAGGYYYLYYSDMMDEKARTTADITRLAEEKKSYEKRKKEYLAYRNEVNQLIEEQKDLLRALPKKDDIEQFIESVNAQVEVAGLSRVASVREAAVPEEMYLRIPIKMSLLGSYHQINRFFKNVGELKRIVTVANLELKQAEGKDVAPGTLKADFIAMTFQFVDKGAPGAAGAGNPQAGGQR